jgi:hypothetical protein
MFHRLIPFQFGTRAILGLAALLVLSFAPAGGVVSSAQAARVTVEFRTALDPYGHWRRHDRWGEVWVPANVDRGWRPYTVGHWVYSEDYGWYWVADRREARWGLVVYHYGRWVRDRELGWVWVPGNEWAPAWVSWRRGHRHIGWAPMPPQQLVAAYRDEPEVWIFVRSGDFTAPRIATVLLRPEPVFVRETVLVNRTVLVADSGGFAVNPGIAPSVVSAVIGAPLRTYRVRPRVLAGTASVPNAVTVQASELKQQDTRVAEAVVQDTGTTIEPEKNVPEPKALADNENGRLGENPPKAARQAARDQDKDAAGQSAEQEKGSGQPAEKSAERKQGEEPASKSAGQKSGEESGKKAAGAKQGDDSPRKSAVKDQGESAKKAAEQRKAEESRAAKDSSGADKSEGKAAERQKGRKAKDKSAGQDRRGGREAAEQKQRRAPAADKARTQQKDEGRAPQRARQAAPQPSGKPETAGQAPKPAAKSAPVPQGNAGKPKGSPGKGKGKE